MEKRFYYSDPLAASWMAKYFGMRFTARWLGPGPEREYECMPDDWHFEIHDNLTGRYFIHPDSLHLLEPQPSDLVKVMGNVGYIPAGEGFAEKYALRMARSNCQPHATGCIIQRNGIAFMWPESEAA